MIAADWPQFLGPERNGVCAETGLLQTWPKEGPPLVWDREVGEGFSGPVVSGDRLILFHRVGNQEVVECLDAATGAPRWKQAYASAYEDQLGKGNGPRSTPVVSGQRVITVGAGGMLQCLDLSDGKKIWSRDINLEYRVRQSYFGVGSTPLVEENLVLVNVGGKDAGIVAFALDTGKEVWKATSDGASYASPIAATVQGARQAIFFTREGVVMLDPRTGDMRFRTRWRARYDASVNAATPLLIGDRLFVSASYETGALFLRLRKDGADVLWKDDDVMSNHYNTCVYHQGYLYGFDGRQEATPSFRCVALEKPRVHWNQPRFGCGSMVLADGNLIVLTERGELLSVAADPAAYREKARALVFHDTPCRAQIALANGRLYARDQKKLACWNLKK
jgi:outer membrane protein assembly factor BamB